MSHAEAWHDYLAIARMNKLGTLPEGFRQWGKSKAGKKALAVVDHVASGSEGSGVPLIGRDVHAFGEGRRRGRILFTNLLFQCGFEIDGLELRKLRIGGRHQVVDVAPFLGPHVAQKLRGDHAVGALGSLAVFFDEALAHVVMQFAIERLELRPRAVDFRGKLGRGHVVARAPELAGVAVPQFFCANVLEFDKTRVLAAHGGADGMPAYPQPGELFGVSRPGHDVRDGVNAQALCALGRRGALGRIGRSRAGRSRAGAVLAFAVHSGQLGCELCLLGEEFGIFRSGGGIQLQQLELAAQGRRQVYFVPAMAFFSERQRTRGGLLVDERAGGLGVIGDVGFDRPLGVRRLGGELEEFGIGAIDEGLGFGRGGCLLGGAVGRAGRPKSCQKGRKNKDTESHSGKSISPETRQPLCGRWLVHTVERNKNPGRVDASEWRKETVMAENERDESSTRERLAQQSSTNAEGEDAAEPREPGRTSNTAKDTNVPRGDDRPQSVRPPG